MVLSLTVGLSTSVLADGDVTINILHTNDVHGRLYQVEDVNNTSMMGIDKVAAYKQSFENAILVDVGDVLHGLPLVNINNGLNAIELMVAAGYDVMAPGNHDFNFGSTRLTELAAVAKAGGLDIISANVFNKTGGELFLPSTKIMEIDGVSVGFFGLTSTTTTEQTHPANVATLEFREYKASAEAAIAKLKDDGAQIIVALAHIHYEYVDKLAEELVIKPDIILEGHDHNDGHRTVGGVLIAGAWEHQKKLGVVTVTVNSANVVTEKTASLITKAEADLIAGVPAVKALADEKRAEIFEAYYRVMIASSRVNLSSARGDDLGATGLRNTEQALGNLVADSMRIMGDADIAFTNGGGIRADIREGNLSKGSFNEILPYGNYLVIKEITPKVLFEALEHGLSLLPNNNGRFPHTSGMNVVYDPLKPVGQRVVSITIAGTTLGRNDTTTKYRLAIVDFLNTPPADGYLMFGDLPTLFEGDSMDDVLIEYVNTKLGGVITAANARVDGRMLSIGPAHWALREVKLAIDAGIVPAAQQGNWRDPAGRIAAAEAMVKVIEKVLDKTMQEIAEEKNWDLAKGTFLDTDNEAVTFLKHAGVVDGVGGNLYGTTVYTRAQIATVVGRAAVAFFDATMEGTHPFNDVPEWAAPYIGYAVENLNIQGIGDGRYGSGNRLDNQTMVVYYYRAFNGWS